MKPKTTLALLVICAIVGVGFYLTGAWESIETPPPPDDDVPTEGVPLFAEGDFDSQAISRVTIEHADNRVVIERQGDAWHQVEPVYFALNRPAVGAVVNAAVQLTYVEALGTNDTRAAVTDLLQGDSVATVTIGFDDETEPVVIELGERLAVGGRGFVAVNEKAYIVGDALHRVALDQSPADWRSRTLDTPRENRARRLSIEHENGTLSVTKRDDGTWEFDTPHDGAASRDEIARLLDGLGGMTVASFVEDAPDDLSAYGLDKPQLRVTVTAAGADGDAHVSTLLVGGATDLKADEFFATWAPTEADDSKPDAYAVFTLYKAQTQRFHTTVDDLRDRRLVDAPYAGVRGFAFTSGDEPVYRLKRSVDGWRFADDAMPFTLDAAVAENMVRTFVDTKADRFVSLDTDSAKAIGTVAVDVLGRDAPVSITAYPAPDRADQVAAIVNGRTPALVIHREQFDAVNRPAVMLRNRILLDAKADEIHTLSVTHGGRSFTFSRPISESGEPGDWRESSGNTFEPSAIDALLAAAAPLRAEAWVSGDVAVGSTSLRIGATGDRTVVLTFADDEPLAHAAGIDTAMRVSSALHNAVRAEFRQRLVIPLAFDALKSMTVESPAATDTNAVFITRHGDNRYVDAAGNVVSANAAATLFDAVAGLSAQRFVDDAPLADERVARRIVVKQSGVDVTIAVASARDDVRRVRVTGTINGKSVSETFEVDALVHAKLTASIVSE